MRLLCSLGVGVAIWIGAVATGRPGPTLAPPARPGVEVPAAPTRTLPKLALTTYDYSFQGGARRSVPTAGVRGTDGRSLLATHPWDGPGPWFSYDRVQWHKNQLAMIRDTGIDVILPVFGGGEGAGSAYRILGLDCLAQALKEVRTEGRLPFHRERAYPLVGMWLDLEAVRPAPGAPVDLKSERGRRGLYAAIRTFFRHIPPEFHARVRVPAESAARVTRAAEEASRYACIVVVTGAAALKEWNETAVIECERRFVQEFGAGLVWIGGADLSGRARGLDGYLAPAGAANATRPPGWLKVASVGPTASRSDQPARTAAVPDRQAGQTLIQSFLAAIRGDLNWVVVDSWNQFGAGREVSPSLEFGLQPRDLTDAGVTQFKGSDDYAAIILGAHLPETIAPKTLYPVEVIVQNTGLKAWGPQNRAGLSYRWYQDGRPIGDAGPLIASPALAPGEARVFTIAITSPMNGARPLPEGDYELRLDMMLPPDQWFSGRASAPHSVPVRVGQPPSLRPTWLGTSLPSLLKAGAAYTAEVRLRNDGAEAWRKGRGMALGYRWHRVTHAGTEVGADVALGTAPVWIPLPSDVMPGAVATVPVTVKPTDGDGVPLPVWNPAANWAYELEWSFFDGEQWLDGAGTPSFREGIAVLDTDPGVSFPVTNLGWELEAGKTVVTKIGLQNNGPETWRKADAKLGHHWYFFDGTEAIWSAGTVPLPQDVAPGETVVVPDVAFHVPDYNGPMYLVFDLQLGGRYASTLANSRGADTLVFSTLITGGRLLPLDLGPAFDTDGISPDTNRGDGDLDGKGGTLPAEVLPPYVLQPPKGVPPLQTHLYPCGLWHRPVGVRSSPQGPVTDMVTFRYPEKRERTPNAVTCRGQRIDLSTGPVAALHLLGCATAPDASGPFTLVFKDGTTLQQAITMSMWTAPPRNGEHVAFATGHRHSPQGDEPSGGAFLNHYTLRFDTGKSLAALVLPQNRTMKLFAITVEALTPGPTAGSPNQRFRLPPNLIPR